LPDLTDPVNLLSPLNLQPDRLPTPDPEPNQEDPEPIVVDQPEQPLPGPSPPNPPSPPVPDVIMADHAEPKGPSLDIKKFTGKKEEAEEFVTNLELYFQLKPAHFTTDGHKIAYALGNIGNGARQWKLNMVQDLNNEAKLTIRWDNWSAFKTASLKNWSEVDSPGSAMNNIFKLTDTAKRGKISMERYIGLFKEYVRKAAIVTDET
jgi:hypothetical protein